MRVQVCNSSSFALESDWVPLLGQGCGLFTQEEVQRAALYQRLGKRLLDQCSAGLLCQKFDCISFDKATGKVLVDLGYSPSQLSIFPVDWSTFFCSQVECAGQVELVSSSVLECGAVSRHVLWILDFLLAI